MPNNDIQGMPIIRSGIENGGKGIKGEVIWLYYVDTAKYLVEKKRVQFSGARVENTLARGMILQKRS